MKNGMLRTGILLILVSLVWSDAWGSPNGAGLGNGATQAVIRQAQELLLKRRRANAAELLLKTIRESKSTALVEKEVLTRELNRVLTLFFTNEGQRNFELAESIRLNAEQGYAPKYEAALQQEDGHFGVLVGQTLAFISTKNCKGVLANIETMAKLNPLSVEYHLLKLKSETCLSSIDSSEAEEKPFEMASKKALFNAFLAQKFYIQKNFEIALQKARESMRADSDYPTGYYWAWKVLEKEEGAGLDEAQVFLSLCKSLNMKMRKKYYLDSELCSNVEAVEEYIKKTEGAGT